MWWCLYIDSLRFSRLIFLWIIPEMWVSETVADKWHSVVPVWIQCYHDDVVSSCILSSFQHVACSVDQGNDLQECVHACSCTLKTNRHLFPHLTTELHAVCSCSLYWNGNNNWVQTIWIHYDIRLQQIVRVVSPLKVRVMPRERCLRCNYISCRS